MEGRQKGLWQRFWRSAWKALGSTRLAAPLLCVLLLSSLVGTLVPQVPAEVGSQQAWAQAIEQRLGHLARLFASLGLFTCYRAPWFLGALALLLLNTLACTVQRAPRVLRSIGPLWGKSARHAIMPESFYQERANCVEWSVPSLVEGTSAAQEGLRRRGYAVYAAQSQDSAHLYAERHAWTEGCTLVSHLAAVVLVLALAARPAVTWVDQGIRLLPGEEYVIGRGRPWALRAGELTIERYPDGQPRRYRVLASLLRASSAQPVASATVEQRTVAEREVGANRPFCFRDLCLHLQGHGPAVEIATPDGTRAVELVDSQPRQIALTRMGLVLRLSYELARQSPAVPGDLVGQQVLFFAEVLDLNGDLVASGSVADGGSMAVQGVPIRLGLGHYTVWQVSHDPTFGLAVVAGVVLAASAGCSLWLPRRRVWLRLSGQRAEMASPDASSLDALARDCQRSGSTRAPNA